jgi:MYXO-CTERM domain-containing protein
VTAPGVIDIPVNRVNDPTVLKDIDSVGFLIYSVGPRLDFRLNGITLTSDTMVAPEPMGAAWALAGVGAALLARRRRRST